MKKILLGAMVAVLFSGCASVPMAENKLSGQIKEISTPTSGNSGLYVYRTNSVVGAALKKDIWVDGECWGETARGTFFYKEVEGDHDHEIATESEFSPNKLMVRTEPGRNYFVEQYLKPGIFVGGANLRLIDDQTGKVEVQKLSLAQMGKCSKPTP